MLFCDAVRLLNSIYSIVDFQWDSEKNKLFFIKWLIIQKIVVLLHPISTEKSPRFLKRGCRQNDTNTPHSSSGPGQLPLTQ